MICTRCGSIFVAPGLHKPTLCRTCEHVQEQRTAAPQRWTIKALLMLQLPPLTGIRLSPDQAARVYQRLEELAVIVRSHVGTEPPPQHESDGNTDDQPQQE